MTRPRNEGPIGGPAGRSACDQVPVLYAIACGSPVAGYIGALVALAHQSGWQVCVVTTPDGRKFVDVPAVAAQTGHPVRYRYKNPGDVDVLPPADAMVVAPATVNTVNKWACGIADTLALGLLIEAYGLGIPIVAMPYTNTAMAAHPAFQLNLARLRGWGVRVLFGDEVMDLPAPGAGAGHAAAFPWQLALTAVGPPCHRRRPVPADRADRPISGPAGVPGASGTHVAAPTHDSPVPAAGGNGAHTAGAHTAGGRGPEAASLAGRNRRGPTGSLDRVPPQGIRSVRGILRRV